MGQMTQQCQALKDNSWCIPSVLLLCCLYGSAYIVKCTKYLPESKCWLPERWCPALHRQCCSSPACLSQHWILRQTPSSAWKCIQLLYTVPTNSTMTTSMRLHNSNVIEDVKSVFSITTNSFVYCRRMSKEMHMYVYVSFSWTQVVKWISPPFIIMSFQVQKLRCAQLGLPDKHGSNSEQIPSWLHPWLICGTAEIKPWSVECEPLPYGCQSLTKQTEPCSLTTALLTLQNR